MIDNIFEFNNIQIYDVMTHRVDVEFIDVEDSREEITELIPLHRLLPLPGRRG